MGRGAIAWTLAALLAMLPVAGCTAAPQPAPAPQAHRSPASPQSEQSPQAGQSSQPGQSRQAGQSPSAPPPQARGRASGCSAATPLKAGRHTMTHDGLRRTFLLAVPKGEGPHPVLLDLHGLGSDAAQESFYSRLAVEGPRRGYVVATPQAADGRMGWTLTGTSGPLPGTSGPDDAGFLAALLDRLESGLCVDRRRAFAAGMSYGAAMSAALICALDGRLAGVGAVGGLSVARPCDRPLPTTLLAFHGTADRAVPYRGGHPFPDATGALRALADLVVLPPVERAADDWARALGCSGRAASRPATGVRLRTWTSCPAGATVRLYTLDGGGHTWPGSVEVPRLGATARNLDATALILDAFDRAPAR
ncbi:alpha/beta hydrolase family esterase [Nonomuraea wenchangensis]|uniref:alpha/beta hydrolase family esterase n=1 Tax=Nonomuraea wenchangensis TaxID=568860 RepID=UPI00384EDB08